MKNWTRIRKRVLTKFTTTHTHMSNSGRIYENLLVMAILRSEKSIETEERQISLYTLYDT